MATKDQPFNEKLVQEPISEDDIDELREEGQGFQRESTRKAAQEPVEHHRRQSEHPEQRSPTPQQTEGGHASRAEHKGLLAHDDDLDPKERIGTGDESITEQRRAAGRFETEGQPTQLEQDFGEINRNLRGSIHDSENKPSILDPEEE